MSTIELQIEESSLIESVRDALLPVVFADAVDFQIGDVLLDRLRLGAISFATNGDGTLGLHAGIGALFVREADVIAAAGNEAPPNASLEFTCGYRIVVSPTGQLQGSFQRVEHDASYQEALADATALAGSAVQAQALIDGFENTVTVMLSKTALLATDVKSLLVAPLNDLPFDRFALSRNGSIVAVRMGQSKDNEDWTGFDGGAIDDHRHGSGWSMFVASAAMDVLMNAAIQPQVGRYGFKTVDSEWQPENGEAVVTSTSRGPFTITGVFGISDTVPIQISFKTAFSVTPGHPSMPNNLTTTLSVGAKADGGVDADIVNDFLAGNFQIPAPAGFRDQDGSFVRDQPLRNLSLFGLGLAVEQAYGDADGMVLAGNLKRAPHRDDPEVSVLYKTPFELRYLVSCRSQRDSGKKIVPTADIHLFEPPSEPDGMASSSARKTNALGASLLTRAVSAQVPAFARGERKGLRIA